MHEAPPPEIEKGADRMIFGFSYPSFFAQSFCVAPEDWNGGRNQAPESSEKTGAHLTSDGDVSAGSTHAPAVSYVYTPTGRKAVVKQN